MRITKRQLKRIIREEADAHYGGGAHEYKRDHGHKAGDVDGHYKDYEGPEGGNRGDHSETDPGHLDYEGGDVHHKAKTALAAIHDLASAAGVEITPGDEEEAAVTGVEELALESFRKRRGRKVSYRQLRRMIREEKEEAAEESGEAGEDAAEEEKEVQAENRRRMKRKLRRIVRETRRTSRRRLNEDEIDTELDNLHKNIKDDIEHIKDLKKDLEDDREEERRAEDAEERKDEALKRRLRRIVRENTRTRTFSRRRRR